jgi:HAD superfamily hydrolase (TIGR01509 family)
VTHHTASPHHTEVSSGRPRAVFFDLDATLVYMDHEVLLQKMTLVCEAMAVSHSVDPKALLDSHRSLTLDLWSRAEAGTISGRDAMRQNWLGALSACGCEAADAADLATQLYWEHRAGVICAYEETNATLEALRNHVTVAVITNGPLDMQLDKLEQHGHDRHFELFLASGELGYGKPDPRIFAHACDKLGVAPQDAWHIGDNLATDVAGAKAAGLTAVWLNRDGAIREDGQPRPDHEITSLTELLPLLGILA